LFVLITKNCVDIPIVEFAKQNQRSSQKPPFQIVAQDPDFMTWLMI